MGSIYFSVNNFISKIPDYVYENLNYFSRCDTLCSVSKKEKSKFLNFAVSKINFGDENFPQIYNDKYFIISQGVFLNEIELRIFFSEFNTTGIYSLIIHLFEKYKQNLTDYLEGVYNIIIFDKTVNKIYILKDNQSLSNLYYTKNLGNIEVSDFKGNLEGDVKQFPSKSFIEISLASDVPLVTFKKKEITRREDILMDTHEFQKKWDLSIYKNILGLEKNSYAVFVKPNLISLKMCEFLYTIRGSKINTYSINF